MEPINDHGITSFHKKAPCAYILTHIKSGSIYIGSTDYPVERKYRHLRNLKNKTHFNESLQKCFNDDEGIVFSWYRAADRERAFGYEQELLNEHALNAKLLNVATYAKTSSKGRVVSEKTREKIRLGNLGKKLTAEHVQKLVASNLGKKRSAETCLRIGLSKTGIVKSLETRRLIGLGNKGKTVSEETKRKIGLGHKGKTISKEDQTRLLASSLTRARKIRIDNIEYRSVKDAATKIELSAYKIAKRCNSVAPEDQFWSYA